MSANHDFETRLLSYRQQLLRYVRNRGLSTDDAEDIVQTTLLSAYRTYGGQNGENLTLALLTTIAKHAIAASFGSSQAKLGKITRSVDDPMSSELKPAVEASLMNPEKTALSGAYCDAILLILKQFSELDRAVLLAFASGMSGKEVAEAVGLTPGNARIRLMRTKRRIQELLAENGWSTED